MTNILRKMLLGAISLFLAWMVFPLVLPLTTVSAAEPNSSGGVAALTSGGIIPECIADPEKVRSTDFSCVQESILHFTNILLLGVALGAFVYLLYGAFLYATAFGEEKKVQQGKKAITYALIGVFIATISRLVVELLRNVLINA